MDSNSPIPLKPAPPVDPQEAELTRLREQVALLRQAAEDRWQEIAVLTRMVEALEAEKIEARSSYDKGRRALEGELAGLRQTAAQAGNKTSKAAKPKPVEALPNYLVGGGESHWHDAYQEVINSTSWKITAPLRRTVMALRRLRGGK